MTILESVVRQPLRWRRNKVKEGSELVLPSVQGRWGGERVGDHHVHYPSWDGVTCDGVMLLLLTDKTHFLCVKSS